MRRLTCFLGFVLPLGLCGAAAAADPDPPHKHYAVSRLPPDPNLATAKPMGRYRGFLRESVDLTPQMPPVGDQGELVSGTAWAVAYAARSYYAGRNEGRNVESPENEASPGYVYNLALQGDCNEGATISKTVEVLQQGAVSLAAFPYKPECQAPPTPLISSAKDFRVKGYHVLDRAHIDDIKGQIERQNPVVVQFRVSPAFEEFRGGGIFDEVDFASAGSEDRWQTLTIIGYNDDKLQAVRVMNSWGRGWGDDGYAWISYAALTNRISGAVVLDVAAWQGVPPKDEPKPEPIAEDKPKPQVIAKDESKEQPKEDVKDEPNDQQKQDVKDEPKEQPRQQPKPKVKPTLADLRNLSCGKINEVRSNGRVKTRRLRRKRRGLRQGARGCKTGAGLFGRQGHRRAMALVRGARYFGEAAQGRRHPPDIDDIPGGGRQSRREFACRAAVAGETDLRLSVLFHRRRKSHHLGAAARRDLAADVGREPPNLRRLHGRGAVRERDGRCDRIGLAVVRLRTAADSERTRISLGSA